MITSHTGGQLGMLGVVRDGVFTLALSGELDIASAPELEAATLQLSADGARAMTLDLRRLEFMDLAGLRVILEVHERFEEQGYTLQLIPGPWQIQRLFDQTGLLKVLPFASIAPE
jgi:anti-sigma B factor antagonist